MELHQIQVTYSAEEDRLLCRASFKGEDEGLQEVRAWLTRRLVRNLWPVIIDALEKQVALDQPLAAHASADIVGMDHFASVEEIRESGSFNNPYETSIQAYPLGEAPILVAAVNFTLNPNEPIRMNLAPHEGPGFEIAFSQTVLHGFCSLLKDAVKAAEWELNLSMPGMLMPSAGMALN
ncbi:MAG TPA: hypothetical protein VJ698_22995 [Noviherbaspirillum sp.]|uniref:hypothetical protein n=1 Tax=Noviherbaspirillum sp. TaxID=1926288 RepID=UPI002B459CA1|nr:hypothetical protein [Noviherbaspirillum sp.]HJV88355.1 hypothetical protein [Noviherbaspirillum sp.]